MIDPDQRNQQPTFPDPNNNAGAGKKCSAEKQDPDRKTGNKEECPSGNNILLCDDRGGPDQNNGCKGACKRVSFTSHIYLHRTRELSANLILYEQKLSDQNDKWKDCECIVFEEDGVPYLRYEEDDPEDWGEACKDLGGIGEGSWDSDH